MKQEFKHQFEKHPKPKGRCPKCGVDKKFRYYEGLPREYGICDRVSSCGHRSIPSGGMNEVSYVEPTAMSIVSPSKTDLFCLKNTTSNFHLFCRSKFKMPLDHLLKWNVGSEGSITKFAYFNCYKKAVNIITIHYQLINGTKDCKRDKTKVPYSLRAANGERYTMCLFGEHLLTNKTICLVESEKTAVIASYFYPQYDWLATGGANKLTREKMDVLLNKEVFYLGDSDKAGKENSTINKLKEYKLNHKIIELFPGRTDGYDLADAIIEGINPDIEHSAMLAVRTCENTKTKNKSDFDKVEQFISERYEIRHNTVSNEIECRAAGSQDRFTQLNDNDLYIELQKNFIPFSPLKLAAVLNSKFVKKHDPFLHYFENLPKWNESADPDHIEKLSTYVPVREEDTQRFKVQFKKMLVRCVACSITEVFNKQAFILVHDKQNSGKSTFCRWLCPPQLSKYIAENINTDKDSQIALAENFIINMDELATLSKAEINQLKAFMSKDVIKARLPYGRRATVMIRRGNFVGSTNKGEFLNDETGSVRWLCFELVENINFNYKEDVNIDLIWSQAYSLFKGGFKYELTSEEIAENEEVNKRYRITTMEQELIQARYISATKDDIGAQFYTATALKLAIEYSNPGVKLNSINIGKALRILGFKQELKYNGVYQDRGYWVNQK